MLALTQPRMHPTALAAGAAGALVLAGLIHLTAAPAFWQHAPAEGWFLALAGVVEIGWAILYRARPTRRTADVGVVLAGALVTLYVATRVLPAPFDTLPEPVDPYGVLAQGAGVVALAALLVLAVCGSRDLVLVRRAPEGFGDFLIVAFTLGWLAYLAATPVGAPLNLAAVPANALNAIPSGVLSSGDIAALPDRQPGVGSGGGPAELRPDGSQVRVAGDLSASASLETPAGHADGRTLDLRLARGPAPVDDATMTAVVSMPGMGGGTTAAGRHLSDGHYELSLPLDMPGTWQVDVRVSTPKESGSARMNLDAGN